MRRFIRNMAILLAPLGLYLIVIVLIDPFNYLNVSRIFDDSLKENIAQHVEQHLYRMIAFENAPKSNISLGDSRANSLYKGLNHDRWANLSYGGASLKESLETFWWCANNFELDTVLLAISFNNYNKYNKRFWIDETLKTKKNVFSYAFSKHTLRASYLLVKGVLSNQHINPFARNMSKEEFWQFQLHTIPPRSFANYAYPENYYLELKRVANFCNEHKIKLIIWIPPTVIDFQQKVAGFNLESEEEKFRADLRSITSLYDYNYENLITQDRDCFRDPLHFTNAIAALICNEIIYNQPLIARYSER